MGFDQIPLEFSSLWHSFSFTCVPTTVTHTHTHTLNNTHTHTHTLLPLSHSGVHTSTFSIPATKPQQQGGNDPATTAVMMESVGGLAGFLTLPNKSPNNSVNIRADLGHQIKHTHTRSATSPTLSNLSGRLGRCCWPVHCVLGALQRVFNTKPWTQLLSHNARQQ